VLRARVRPQLRRTILREQKYLNKASRKGIKEEEEQKGSTRRKNRRNVPASEGVVHEVVPGFHEDYGVWVKKVPLGSDESVHRPPESSRQRRKREKLEAKAHRMMQCGDDASNNLAWPEWKQLQDTERRRKEEEQRKREEQLKEEQLRAVRALQRVRQTQAQAEEEQEIMKEVEQESLKSLELDDIRRNQHEMGASSDDDLQRALEASEQEAMLHELLAVFDESGPAERRTLLHDLRADLGVDSCLVSQISELYGCEVDTDQIATTESASNDTATGLLIASLSQLYHQEPLQHLYSPLQQASHSNGPASPAYNIPPAPARSWTNRFAPTSRDKPLDWAASSGYHPTAGAPSMPQPQHNSWPPALHTSYGHLPPQSSESYLYLYPSHPPSESSFSYPSPLSPQEADRGPPNFSSPRPGPDNVQQVAPSNPSPPMLTARQLIRQREEELERKYSSGSSVKPPESPSKGDGLKDVVLSPPPPPPPPPPPGFGLESSSSSPLTASAQKPTTPKPVPPRRHVRDRGAPPGFEPSGMARLAGEDDESYAMRLVLAETKRKADEDAARQAREDQELEEALRRSMQDAPDRSFESLETRALAEPTYHQDTDDNSLDELTGLVLGYS